MEWVPWVAWAGAVVFAAIVLGFCAYEIMWKANRLRVDLARLRALESDAVSLRDALVDASERLTRAGLR
jgi:hypothetical protein